MSESQTFPIICPYDCPSTCGLLATVENGRITSVRNDPSHPVSCRVICSKMQHYERSVHSDKRLLTPLKRTGPKGSGKFAPISWEEAVQLITDRWKSIVAEYGGEAILPAIYSGVMSDIQRNCGDAFFNRLGASVLVKTLCSDAKGAGYKSVMGSTGALDPRELEQSDFYLIWGSNLVATRLQTLADIGQGEHRAKKKILIDTYANPTARICDDVILIRAGSDGALALAMMNWIVSHDMSDEEFLHQYADHYDEFKKTLSRYTPEWAEEKTGIPAAKITWLAREYVSAKAPAIILGSGPSRRRNGGMITRLIVLLSTITGAWKVPGGGYCGSNPTGTSYNDLNRIRRPDFRKKPARRININQIASALQMTGDSAIRSLYVYALNPADTLSNQSLLLKGLSREDLFTVVHERFMTDTARYADIVLPATFSVEQSDIYRCYGYCTLGTQRKILQAPGLCLSNWDTFALLAKGMGFEEDYFRQTEDEMLDDILDHPTDAVKALPPEKKKVLREGGSVSMPFADHLNFQTPTGKIQFYDASCPDPLATYTPDEADDLPLRLVAAPSRFTLNTEFTDRNEQLAARKLPVLWIHTDDADARNISDGQQIVAFNDLAEVYFTAKVTDQVARGNAVCEGVWLREQTVNGCTYNALTHDIISDIGEATCLNGSSVDVRPA